MSTIHEGNQNVASQTLDVAAGLPAEFDWRTIDPAFLEVQYSTFQKEFLTYRERIAEILTHPGEYVIISGDRVVGFHAKLEDAAQAAFDEFGRDLVLIKKVVETEVAKRLGRV